jgi:hypothetical protein
MSVAQAMCIIQGGAAVVASETWLVAGPTGRSAATGAAILGATLIAGVGLLLSRQRNPLVSAEHLDEVWDTIRSTCGPATSPPGVTITTKGMVVAVSPLEPGWHVSFSHPQRSTLEVALSLGGTVVSVSSRVVQFVIGPSWSSGAPTAAQRFDPTRSRAADLVASGVPDAYFTAPSVSSDRRSRTDAAVGKIAEHGWGVIHEAK